MKQNSTIYLLFIILLFFSFTLKAQIGVPPNPNAGTATVDGDISEWDLDSGDVDWFANMHKAWNVNKEVLSSLYLRYDCSTEIMYALVYHKNDTIPFDINGDHWIAIDGKENKVIQESDGNNGTPPDFQFVGVNYDGNPNHARGYEAAFVVLQSSLPANKTTDITAHANIDESGTLATSGTGGKEIDLIIDCSVLPVEMTSFSVTIENSLARLNWETATEINNYGFEVQRSSETENWAKVGFVEGHGNSNSPKYYSFKDLSVSQSGNYYYRLKQIDIDGQFEYSDVVNVNLNINEITYKLEQNYPNPFNPSTTISYTIPEETHVKIIIYNVFGEEVTTLVEDTKEIGSHSIIFNAENLSSGVYYYILETESYVTSKKLLLLK